MLSCTCAMIILNTVLPTQFWLLGWQVTSSSSFIKLISYGFILLCYVRGIGLFTLWIDDELMGDVIEYKTKIKSEKWDWMCYRAPKHQITEVWSIQPRNCAVEGWLHTDE